MEGIEKMYQSYAMPVKRYVLSLCKNNTLADDITADTFYKAINNINSFKEGSMLTWLCSIARNTYLDYRKKKETDNVALSQEMEMTYTKGHDNVEASYIRKEEKLQLYRMIYKLDEPQKDVMYLRIFGELSFKEIGSILGKSENWVRVNFYRSKNKLKGWVENGD